MQKGISFCQRLVDLGVFQRTRGRRRFPAVAEGEVKLKQAEDLRRVATPRVSYPPFSEWWPPPHFSSCTPTEAGIKYPRVLVVTWFSLESSLLPVAAAA